MLLAKMYFFPSKNENLFKNLNSLNFRSVPFIYEPIYAILGKCWFSVAGFYCNIDETLLVTSELCLGTDYHALPGAWR